MLSHWLKRIATLSSRTESGKKPPIGTGKAGLSIGAPKRSQNPPLLSRYLKRNYMVPTFQRNTDSSESNLLVTSAVAEVRTRELLRGVGKVMCELHSVPVLTQFAFTENQRAEKTRQQQEAILENRRGQRWMQWFSRQV